MATKHEDARRGALRKRLLSNRRAAHIPLCPECQGWEGKHVAYERVNTFTLEMEVVECSGKWTLQNNKWVKA